MPAVLVNWNSKCFNRHQLLHVNKSALSWGLKKYRKCRFVDQSKFQYFLLFVPFYHNFHFAAWLDDCLTDAFVAHLEDIITIDAAQIITISKSGSVSRSKYLYLHKGKGIWLLIIWCSGIKEEETKLSIARINSIVNSQFTIPDLANFGRQTLVLAAIDRESPLFISFSLNNKL